MSDCVTAQRILLHADDDSIDLSELTVLDNLVPFDILGGTKPEIFGGEHTFERSSP